MSTGTMQEDFSQTHHKRLLGMIRQALDFGGNAQLARADQALVVLMSRMAALKAAVKGGNGAAQPAADLERMIHARLLEVVEDGFDHPSSHLLRPAEQALVMLRPRLDKRKADINEFAEKYPVTI